MQEQEKIKLTVNELFSGIGCQSRGFENSKLFDVRVLTTSDIYKEAVLSYAAIHCGLTNEIVENYSDYPSREEMAQYLTDLNLGYNPEKDTKFDWFKLVKRKKKDLEKYWLACQLTNNLGDISKIDELPYADLWTVSFPCFVEGTLVLTKDGYKAIESVTSQDFVLTHNNQYKKVVKSMINHAEQLYKIDTMPSESLYTTENHPFYIRHRYKKWNNDRRMYDRKFSEPVWVKAKDLDRDCFVGTAINTESKLPTYDDDGLESLFEQNDFWYVVGRYIGDGWIRSKNGIIICGHSEEIGQIISKVESLGIQYNTYKGKTVDNVYINFKNIGLYFEQFGKGAANKHLTSDIIDLPKDKLKSFLDGYIDSDGCYIQGLYKITSVSRELIYGVGQCVAKAYNRPFSVYFIQRPKKHMIEGRIVNQRDTYQITFKLDTNTQDKAFYEDGYIWSPVNDVQKYDYDGLVYNLEVEEDNSYVVQNIIVHNCTDISVAGKMRGLNPDSGTRSSLLWDNIRLLKKAKDNNTLPKYLMFENVKNLVSKKFINDFNNLLDVLTDLGFNSYWKVINGKDCGVPQNRERVFVICIRKDIDNGTYEFPKPFDTGVRLKDVLEETFDEKYYIAQDKMDRFITSLNNTNALLYDVCQIKREGKAREYNQYSPTLTSRDYKDPRVINDNVLKQVGQMYGTEKEPNPQAGRVYDEEGLSPTLDSCSGGNRMLKILQVGKLNSSQDGVVVSTDGIAPTHTAGHGNTPKILDKSEIRIRKLTPRECFKLQGLTFEDCDKARDIGVADMNLYKQAGNGIITNCCELLIEHLYKAQYDSEYVCTDEEIVNFQQPQVE
jgi:DNA-cytosine methyltransferase